MHFHGTEVRKPIPSYQIYKGNLFDLVDQAVDFVMSKITRAVGTRAKSAQAPVTYELPKEAVAEAVVNAVGHRDYASNASVQVMLFSDRLEVWNPGQLPPSLTPELLRRPHASIPHNPMVAEPLFLARYIEKAGSGTLDMIDLCRKAGLPQPEFRQDGGQFVQTLWRDWLTREVLAAVNLNDRQRRAVEFVKQHGRITNKEYQDLAKVAERTALRDLGELVGKGFLAQAGSGRGAHYVPQTKTRQKPAKPATDSAGQKTRRKPAKPAGRSGTVKRTAWKKRRK